MSAMSATCAAFTRRASSPSFDLALNEPPAILSRELVYCRFPLLDGTGNPRWLFRAAIEMVAALLRGDTPSLVYCGAGMSRSPCIAAAAISQIRGCPAAEGLAIALQSAAADVSPGLWAEVREIVETIGSRPREKRIGRRLDVEDADQGHGDLAAEADVDVAAAAVGLATGSFRCRPPGPPRRDSSAARGTDRAGRRRSRGRARPARGGEDSRSRTCRVPAARPAAGGAPRAPTATRGASRSPGRAAM